MSEKLPKKLTLNRETLRELLDEDLDRAAGAGIDSLQCPPRTVRPLTICCPPPTHPGIPPC